RPAERRGHVQDAVLRGPRARGRRVGDARRSGEVGRAIEDDPREDAQRRADGAVRRRRRARRDPPRGGEHDHDDEAAVGAGVEGRSARARQDEGMSEALANTTDATAGSLARPGEFRPLAIGPLSVWPPVVLAPMAGVTNYPFRSLCREFGAGLYVSEMITARPLCEGNGKTLRLAGFGPEETTRSLQLYGVDPYYVGEAAKRLAGEGRVDHIDLNFGCPVRKVTRRGGGAAIPLKPKLLANIVRAAVRGADKVPVTIKF